MSTSPTTSASAPTPPPQPANPTHQPTDKALNGGRTSLLALPAELRNHIYSLVVCRTFTIDILDSGDSSKTSKRVAQPAVARTSRQLRREVLPMFYGNAFEIDCSQYSRYLRPGRVLMDLEEREFVCTMGRNEEILQGFATVRRWLRNIGEGNRASLGEVLVCCAEEDAVQLLEMALVRFDVGSQCLMACADYPLLEGWSWQGRSRSEEMCAANVRYGAGLQHYRVVLTV
ncbi:hypothetical protein DOTSEDRAFT_33920 [Dothistroma septosporum NZE10]|uniref:F-box domain-containing protein n=1 Tax=Dothistroma septosporum (strain NZE10 / CBS 128990) TaxID=675120 RepID=N1PPU5_DOTSN|nr:hypothetical protein DOTSEDRAFT_33920 [Dothistroma septosporum NZE10]